VFGLWTGIALVSGLAAMAGYGLLADAPPQWLAAITAFAGGAILSMVADTMIPEAFERTHVLTGLVTTLGFLASFALERA
jgi:ZIP family zinc transporter